MSGEPMTREEARRFVLLFDELDEDEQVELLKKHDLHVTDHVPERADELRQWKRACVNRAKSEGKIDDLQEDIERRVRQKKSEAAPSLGIRSVANE